MGRLWTSSWFWYHYDESLVSTRPLRVVFLGGSRGRLASGTTRPRRVEHLVGGVTGWEECSGTSCMLVACYRWWDVDTEGIA